MMILYSSWTLTPTELIKVHYCSLDHPSRPQAFLIYQLNLPTCMQLCNMGTVLSGTIRVCILSVITCMYMYGTYNTPSDRQTRSIHSLMSNLIPWVKNIFTTQFITTNTQRPISPNTILLILLRDTSKLSLLPLLYYNITCIAQCTRLSNSSLLEATNNKVKFCPGGNKQHGQLIISMLYNHVHVRACTCTCTCICTYW